MNSKILIETYYDGLREGVEMYAHWKDGVQYVGTTGKTLKQALDQIEKEFQQSLKKQELQ